MQDQEFRKNVAEKITYYRKQSGLTQSKLAEKLNYSDKSVSKWERGEGLPDLFVLYQMAEMFGVTLNDLTGMVPTEKKTDSTKKMKHLIITVLSVLIVWLTASAVFFALKVTGNVTNLSFFRSSWLAFIYAVPASFIVLTVFSCIWYGTIHKLISVSGIIWSVFLTARLTVAVIAESKVVNYLLIVCAIVQVMAILWFYMRSYGKQKEKTDKTEKSEKSE